jgi:catechol 2,3-dioxygenase-like lactoylglutathione lyase family enzyme
MILNHIDLQVSDINSSRKFFETYFDMVCSYERPGSIAIMQDEGGFCFGLSNLFASPPPTYPPDFHIGFVLRSEDQVREIYERLKTAGIVMKVELAELGPSLAFQCLAPDSVPVEVSCRLEKREC